MVSSPKKKKKNSKEFKCKMCDYSCEKDSTLKKHMNSKHTKQKCKQCDKEFRTSMELLNHVAKEHQEEEEEGNGYFKSSTPKSKKEGKGSSFVFGNSILDEFL